jgi:hypothetical protein
MNIFLDSMVYVKSVPVEQIDFCDMLRSDSVTVQLPRVTVRELEQLKSAHHSPWIRDRAAHVLASMDSLIAAGDGTQGGVHVHFIPTTPHVEMTKYRLNPEWSNDWLMAAVLECKETHSASDTVLMTDGIDARLTCRHLRIDTLELPPKYRQRQARNAEKYVGGLR